MRVLTFSTLFPNEEMPYHGIFVAERLKHLLESGRVEASVLAPVPWFPIRSPVFGAYARYARVAATEQRGDMLVRHPRYPSIPKVGMSIAPLLLAMASRRIVRREFGSLDEYDLIDAHYFYPDGVAAAILGRWFGKPVIITGRGTDLNLIPDYRIPRLMIRWAARQAAALVTVSEALRSRLIDLEVPPEKIHTLRNGVDLEKFRPADRTVIGSRVNRRGTVLLTVGNLIEGKGHHFAIGSLQLLRNATLIIAGRGPQEGYLRGLADRLEVGDRVMFLGAVDQTDLIDYYNAADCLILCSRSEGMPNVVLESLACGTPVVAASTGGIPEVVRNSIAGVLLKERSAAGVAAAVKKLLSAYPDKGDVRRYAEQFGWGATTAGQLELFEQVVRQRSSA